MPLGYHYRCRSCQHEWVLFSTRYKIGPVEWESVKWTCFSCLTFLSIAAVLDRTSWRLWREGRFERMADHPKVAELIQTIDDQINTHRPYSPFRPSFAAIDCPTCDEPMSTTPYGQGLMKCPNCERDGGEGINLGMFIYYE